MERLTKEQAIVITAFTGVATFTMPLAKMGMIDDDFHEYIEKILERPVMTHELASKEVWEQIKEKSRPDFEKLAYQEEETPPKAKD